MASPQLENGYTMIANELLDALARIRIPGEAAQVLRFILRKTYGYKKKADIIPISQFVAGTGMKKVAVCKAVKKLLEMNLIIKGSAPLPKKVIAVTKKGNGIASTYELNKDSETWCPLPKKVTLPKKVIAVTKKGNSPLPKKLHSKETIQKKIQKKEDAVIFPENLDVADFIEVWNLWVKYRIEKKNSLKATTIKLQLKKLSKWGREKAIAALEQSMMQGWTGIFEPKNGTEGNSQKSKPETVMELLSDEQPLSPEELAEIEAMEERIEKMEATKNV